MTADEEEQRERLKRALRPHPLPIGKERVTPSNMLPRGQGKLIKFPGLDDTVKVKSITKEVE